MTEKPGDGIPQDVMQAAHEIMAEWWVTKEGYEAFGTTAPQKLQTFIARAIMAERQRCLEHCDYIIQNIDVQSKRRSRFDIYDLGRAYRDGAKHVKERIDGSYKDKWKPNAEEVNPLPVFGDKVAKP